MLLRESAVVGAYILEKKLGEGRFGQVWLARHGELNVERALKIPTDYIYLRLLKQEAMIQTGLCHPNIVQALDLSTQTDPPFVVMEYVRGEDLRKRLRSKKRLRPEEAVSITFQVLDALEAAHSRGVLHRDLKPENVLITPQRQVKVTDFGLGGLMEVPGGSILISGSITRVGISGTYDYMSPEQKEGADPDVRDDLYSVGVILCEMLVGARPSGAGVGRMLRRDGIQGRLVDVLEQALDHREFRLASAADLRSALLEVDRRAGMSVGSSGLLNTLGQGGRGNMDEEVVWADAQARGAATAPPAAGPAYTAPAPHVHPAADRAAGISAALAGFKRGVMPYPLRRGPGWEKSQAPEAAPPSPPAGPAWDGDDAFRTAGAAPSLSPSLAAASEWPSPLVHVWSDQVVRNSVGMELVKVPVGEFWMGLDDEEEPAELAAAAAQAQVRGVAGAPEAGIVQVGYDSTPHRVRLSRPFYIGVLPVTQEQWCELMWRNPSCHRGALMPVESVTWQDAAKFCARLSRREGRTYRLPTEAEWEYACRAGSDGAFNVGRGGDPSECAWHRDNSRGATHPPGLKRPNAWGLYDMHGNVWEWCEDVFADYPRHVVCDYCQAEGPQGAPRILRGGSFARAPWECRSAVRFWLAPGLSGQSIGFRVVMDG